MEINKEHSRAIVAKILRTVHLEQAERGRELEELLHHAIVSFKGCFEQGRGAVLSEGGMRRDIRIYSGQVLEHYSGGMEQLLLLLLSMMHFTTVHLT